MTQRIILITGANRGLGLEAARQLAGQGHHVIMAGRSADGISQASNQLKIQNLSVEPLTLDVTSAASITSALQQVSARHDHIDSLINNAGVLLDYQADITKADVDVWRQTFEGNLFGAVGVTTAFLPLLQASSAGRIVNVSSALGSMTLNAHGGMGSFAQAYNASKAALNMYTLHLAQALATTSIKVNAAHPGWVKTDMGGPDAMLEVEVGAKTLVDLATLPDDGPTASFCHLGEALPW